MKKKRYRIVLCLICILSITLISVDFLGKKSPLFSSQIIPIVRKYIAKTGVSLSPEKQQEIAMEIVYTARKTQLPLSLLVAIVNSESHFNPKALSPIGAIGLGQINPYIWLPILKEESIISYKKELFVIRNNLDAIAFILKRYLKKSNGNIKMALGRYNGLNTTHTEEYISIVSSKEENFKIFLSENYDSI